MDEGRRKWTGDQQERGPTDSPKPDALVLMELARMRMPFGKFKGTLLCELPEFYLVWFARQGFPKGRLGELLATLYEIKLNGLEYLLLPLRRD